jgi:hypothetical protein
MLPSALRDRLRAVLSVAAESIFTFGGCMKKSFVLITLGLGYLVAVGSAQAASDQQNKMATCNADAKTKELKGDERKKFMSECLKAK